MAQIGLFNNRKNKKMEKEIALKVLTQICEASNKAGILNLADAVNAVNALQSIRELIDDNSEKK